MYTNISGKQFIEHLRSDGPKVTRMVVDPSAASSKTADKFQFEWHAYVMADRLYGIRAKLRLHLTAWLRDS